MITFLLRRLGAGIILIFAISTLTFFLTAVAGSDPARRILGTNATPEQIAAKNAELGLDQPVLTRYVDWLTAALHGDMGTSWANNQPVTKLLTQALPVSLSVILIAVALTALVSIVLGVVAAVRGGWLDQVLQTVSIVAFAIPNFLVGIVLALVFAVQLRMFPALGYVDFATDPGKWLASITLPAVALAIGAIGTVATQTRGSMIDVLQKDYIRTLRSRGLPLHSVLFKHALRNAAPASLTILSLQFIALLGGAVIIEKVFALTGIGGRAAAAAAQGDVPLVLGVVVVMVVLVVIVNLLVDIALGFLNPKVRAS